MDEVLIDIAEHIRAKGTLTTRELGRILAVHNKAAGCAQRAFAKKDLWPSYLRAKSAEPARVRSWGFDEQAEELLRRACRMKPRRTASGVATITVITKPAPCAGNCLFCPSDVRMPKSYIHNEPACQRAERNCFDPYLQVASRLRALTEMGHSCDKVELIVLGGTFTDYAPGYQRWFASELFRALNEFGSVGAGHGVQGTGGTPRASAPADKQHQAPGSHDEPPTAPEGTPQCDTPAERRARYAAAGIACDPAILAEHTQRTQKQVNDGAVSFNQAIAQLYGPESAWEQAARWQTAGWEELECQHAANEGAAHRCVGLVVETRPDCISAPTLQLLRRLGCTKIQLGVQSLREEVLADCCRATDAATVQGAFELLRAFGFKSHAHFMVNLPGMNPEGDAADYRSFMTDAAYQPDEVKLYPCALIAGTGLEARYRSNAWQPYAEDELVELLASCVLATPAHTRISRMIRDFSSGDIVVGNKKANLRQMVDARLAQRGAAIREIRSREIATGSVDVDALELRRHTYPTTNTVEHFLEWVDEQGRIAGFLRLSLPQRAWMEDHAGELPTTPGQAMIREVHVYGTVSRLEERDGSAQHAGLGKRLVQEACEIARAAGYSSVNVISAIGTRNYYRSLGFADAGLYQRTKLG